MADTIVIVGNEVGDDFTTTSAAYAAIPADITATGGHHIIQIRTGATTSNYFAGTVTDATHQLKFHAFPGDEVNGKGEGASIASNSGLGVIRTSSLDYFEIDGLLIEQTGTSRCILYGSGNHPTITNSFIKSTSGNVIEIGNSAGGFLSVDNVILLSNSGRCVSAGNTSDSTLRSFNRVTAISLTGSNDCFRQVNSTLGQERKTVWSNCIAFPSSGLGFNTTFAPIFESDFNASGDATSSLASTSTSFNGRTITTDLEDPSGGTPDYNLKSTSTLVGAGDGGSDIGATLGTVTPPSGITITPTLGTINYTSQNTTVQLSGVVDVTATLGLISYSSQNTTVQLSGEIDLNTTLGAINYSSKNTTVQISGDVNVNAGLGTINYSSKNTSIQISGDIVANATLGLINYSSNNVTVQLFGEVEVLATLGTINYSSNNVVVGLTSGIALNTTLGQISYTSKNTTVLLQGEIIIPATLGLISYASNPVNITISGGQIIGVVTAGFADDIYSAGFKPDSITVNFKT